MRLWPTPRTPMIHALFIDNYKPNTGLASPAVNLIHNIFGRRRKDPADPRRHHQPARPVHCFQSSPARRCPTDHATLARLLLIAFEWQAGQPNLETGGTDEQRELSAIGLLWLTMECAPRRAAGHQRKQQSSCQRCATTGPAALRGHTHRIMVSNHLARSTRHRPRTELSAWSIALPTASGAGQRYWLAAMTRRACGDSAAADRGEHKAPLRRQSALEAVRFLSGLPA